jgi:acetylornithine aminotransferase
MTRIFGYPGHQVLLPDVVRAEGPYLYDSGGRRYVDLESGVWCMSLGHGHPRLLGALRDQASRIAHAGFIFSSPIVEEAASEILDLLGMEEGRCVFLCSGSEAVEYGVRAARASDDRPLLITMSDSYFGAYGSAWRRDPEEWFDFDWSECSRCPRDFDCGPSCRRWAEIPFDRIAGFLFEPGSSSGMVRFPPSGLIERLTRTVREDGGLVLVNEVTTGIGRTGRWFGFRHYGLEPDVVAMGKGLGNGYPVSATAFAARVVERLGGGPVRYAQSHQNDPLGAAVAREVVRIIREEGLIERSLEAARILRAGLDAIAANNPRIKEVRSRGLLAAVELEDDSEDTLSRRVLREILNRGFVLAHRSGHGVLRVDPPLTIGAGDLRDFLNALEEVLAE